MKPILHFMIRATAASALSVLLWFTSFFAFNQTFLLSSAYAAGALQISVLYRHIPAL